MPSSFENKKQIRVVITLGTGKFGASNNNQITLQGFRTVIDIDKAGWHQMGTLRAQIYGMSRSDMNAATVLQWRPGYLIDINLIQVYAIDGERETLIFTGNIVNAWANYSSAPDVYFQVQAQTAYHAALNPVAPRSYKGAVSVATIASQIAASMSLTFENNGVTAQLSNVYLDNTDLVQLKTLADSANIDYYVDDTVLAICRKDVARNGSVAQVTAKSGLRGYPTFDALGVSFQTLYNPALTFGGKAKVISEVPQATGEWIVTSIAHKLESEKQNGSWFSSVRGIPNGIAIT